MGVEAQEGTSRLRSSGGFSEAGRFHPSCGQIKGGLWFDCGSERV